MSGTPIKKEKTDEPKQESEMTRLIFDDFESRLNIVGLFDLLYKIDKRNNPQLYIASQTTNNTYD